jgi:hypothetical protein
MDFHNSLNLTSLTTLSLRYYSLHLESIFTAEQVLTRKDMPSKELLYIINFDLYTVSKTLLDAT